MIDLNKFHVRCFAAHHEGWGKLTHVKIQKITSGTDISWEEMQEIKTLVAGKDAQALEVYPPQSETPQETKIRHLWIIGDWVQLPGAKTSPYY